MPAPFDQNRKLDLAVGEIPVTLTVAAMERRPDATDIISALDDLRRLQIGSEQIAFGVDVGRDMMGDLAVIVTEADPAIERHGAKPDRPVLLTAVEGLPKSDVVTPIGASADGLFKGQVLRSALAP